MVTNLRQAVHLQELSGCKAVDRSAVTRCVNYQVKILHRGVAAARVEQSAFDAYEAMPASLATLVPGPVPTHTVMPSPE